MPRPKAELRREIEEAFGLVKGWTNIARLLGCSRETLRTRWREWGVPIFFLGGHQRKTPATFVDYLRLWIIEKMQAAHKGLA